MDTVDICLPLLFGGLFLMSSPSSSAFPVLGHETGLVPPTVLAQTDIRSRVTSSPTVISAEGDCSKDPAPLAAATFSETLIFGVGCQGKPSVSPSASHAPDTASTPSQSAGMSALCLLGKPWGDPIPLAIVMSKTRKDWSFIKGQLDYLELGNGWLLFRFSNMQDITLVWNGRPWHVSGLNLVLRRWEPYFDPYSATIERIDQWVKITRLPLELWEEETLKQLLHEVGQFIKVDDVTLNRSKGKFARVCLNIDISKPLRGSLFLPIPHHPRPLEVPISYEGLHEVCAWCGSNAHDLDACPETPKGPIEVIVEKFGAATIQNNSCSQPTSSSSPLTEKWVTVSPKKRGRSFPFSRRKSNSQLATAPASPVFKIISTCQSPPKVADNFANAAGPGILPLPSDVAGVVVPADGSGSSLEPPVMPSDPAAAATASGETMVGAVGPTGLSHPAVTVPSPLAQSSPANSHQFLASPASPLTGSVMDEEDVDMFLNIEPDDEVQLSPESSKKRKLESGEASSPTSSSN